MVSLIFCWFIVTRITREQFLVPAKPPTPLPLRVAGEYLAPPGTVPPDYYCFRSRVVIRPAGDAGGGCITAIGNKHVEKVSGIPA